MELVKYSPEEQAKIERDQSRPHAVVCVCGRLDEQVWFQESYADLIEQGMVALKDRADRAKMQILSTSISTDMIMTLEGRPYAYVMILCQWVEIEKLHEMQRRAVLVGGPVPGRGA